jgi:hypothetical protein
VGPDLTYAVRPWEIGALLFLSNKEEQGNAIAIGDIRTLKLR